MTVKASDNFIRSLGVEAYRVGGSVRDELLGRTPKDADYMVRGVSLFDLEALLHDTHGSLTTNLKLSPLRLRQGGQFGWRAAARGLGCIEIALPRTDLPTGPGREMQVTVDPELGLADDARRRDFTFNALYKPLMDGYADDFVADPCGRGLYDLSHRLIETTYPESFRDDPLRTLRALRFVSRGFDLTETTTRQMTRYASEVGGLTARGHTSGTVLDELSKILMGDRPDLALRIARDTGVLAVAIPELAPMLRFEQGSRYHDLTTDEHTFVALATAAHVGAPLRVRMALLFHDVGKPESQWFDARNLAHYYAKDGTEDHEVVGARIWRTFAKRVNASRELRDDVAKLIREHMVSVEGSKSKAPKVRRDRVRFGDDMLRDLYLHRMCDLSAKGGTMVNLDHIKHIGTLEAERQAAQDAGVPAGRKDLQITGKDIKADSRDIGRVLSAVLDEVVVDPSPHKLTREWQLTAAERLAR